MGCKRQRRLTDNSRNVGLSTWKDGVAIKGEKLQEQQGFARDGRGGDKGMELELVWHVVSFMCLLDVQTEIPSRQLGLPFKALCSQGSELGERTASKTKHWAHQSQRSGGR